VLQGVAGCCSVLQALLQSQLQCVSIAAGRNSYKSVCCSKLQCVAASRSAL